MTLIAKDMTMPRLAYRLLLAGCAGLLSLWAQAAAPHLGLYLKTYYTDYQVVKDCAAQHHLADDDVAKAKDALAKIEAYYVHRDPSINKEKLMKLAIQNKAAAYKIMRESSKIDLGVYCRSTLKDLMSKLHDIDADARAKKNGS
jgi:hypothetical protein